MAAGYSLAVGDRLEAIFEARNIVRGTAFDFARELSACLSRGGGRIAP
jgi:hypothetical protein